VSLTEAGLLSKVHLRRREIVQGLMDPPVIVEVEVAGQVLPGLFRMGIVVQIDFFVLYRSPQAFGEDTCTCAARKRGASVLSSARPLPSMLMRTWACCRRWMYGGLVKWLP